MSEYKHYRYLAMLCIAFNLSNKGTKTISVDEVKNKIKEIFPEEKNFLNLFQEPELMKTILIKDNNLIFNEVGIELAQQQCDSIKRVIKMRAKKFRCVSNICQGKEIILFAEIVDRKCPHCGSTIDLREVV